MPLLSFASDQRRIRKQHKLDRQRATRKSIRGQLETLEDRKLLAVDMNPANFGQLFSAGTGLQTQQVEHSFSVSHGGDAALVVAGSYTDTAPFPAVDVTLNGVTQTLPLVLSIGTSGPVTGVSPFGGGIIEGYYDSILVGPPSTLINGTTQLNSFVLIVPIGTEAMNRDATVRLRGGVSTDFIAYAGPLHGVNQLNPVDDFGGKSSGAVTSFTTLDLAGGTGLAEVGNLVIDALTGIQRQPAVQSLTNLIPDFNATDPGGNQVELLEDGVVTSTSLQASVRGAVGTDRGDLHLEWQLAASAAAFSHAAVEVNMASPATPVFYDGGDAPSAYGVAIHAPKGPMLGVDRDSETLSTIAGFMGATALGDDLDNRDDEDGVTNLQTNGNSLASAGALGAFVSQSMANNAGSVDVQVSGLTAGQTGYLTIYVDWNRDGDFADTNETVQAGVPVTSNGNSTYSFNVPVSSQIVPGASYMRVRLHTASMGDAKLLPAAGHANDGEVEDYKIELIRGTEIHGIKFEDINGNGVRDAGDPIMAGVAMTLPGAVDIWGNPVAVTYSNAQGEFWFNNLGAGAFTVSEDLGLTDINGDKIFDSNPGGLVGKGYSIGAVPVDQGLRRSTKDVVFDKLTQGQIVNGVEFGNYIAGSIHGFKFEDQNLNGTYQPAIDNPMEGIVFDLYRFVRTDVVNFTSGKVVTTFVWEEVDQDAKTDKHGEFWFTGLAPGKYEIVEQKGNHVQTTQQSTIRPGIRDDDKNDNTIGLDPATSKTLFEIVSRREYVWEAGASARAMDFDKNGIISNDEAAASIASAAMKVEVLAPASLGQASPENNLWFGNYQAGSITGFKYEDMNQNGTFDKGEPGLAGVVFKLSGGALTKDVYTTTDVNGKFEFKGIVPSATKYSVNEVAWDDLNKDGKVDAKDQFTDTNSKADKDFTGNSFGIPDSMQGMIIDTTPRTFTISSGTIQTKNLEWGNFVTGSIHGFKFEDKDASGTAVGESGLAGIVFDLYKFVRTDVTTFTSGKVVTTFVWDNLTDGLPNKDAKNVDIDAAVSGKHGEFWFTGLDEGKYEVVERAAQGDWVQSTSQSKISPIVRDDDKDKNVLTVGLDPAKSATLYTIISGREYAWSDQLNKQDAKFDYQDIYIRDVDGDGKVTDVDRLAHHNQWALKELVLPPPGLSGEQNDLWFGNYKLGSITGIKYEDVNQNGTFDNGEPTLAGVVFRLSGGALPATGKGSSVLVTTGADGKFSFGNLVPSSKAYSVNEVDFFDLDGDKVEDLGEFTDTNRAADIAATKAIYGGSGFGIRDSQQGMIIDETARTFTISSGTNLVDDKIDSTSKTKNLDWGNYITGSIHGYKFEDTDGSGSLNGKEAALAGITFDLYKFVRTDVTAFTSGKVVTTYIWDNLTDGVGAKDVPAATTDSHGEFWFTGLDAGTYEVVERNPDATKWGQSTKQPTEGPGTRDDGDKNANTKGINPATSSTAFEVLSRREYVWTAGAASRVMNMDQDPAISNAEKLAGYNKGALKTEILAPASFGQTAPENNLWFGNFRFGTITGFKYEDLNQNGTQDKDEPGLSGVVFKLSGGALGNTVRYTTTKAGSFTFDKIVPSATPYSVNEVAWDDLNKDGKVDAKDQFTDTNSKADKDFTGNSFGIPDSMQGMIINTTPRTFTISSGDTPTKNLDWGNFVTGSIHGFKFEDKDASGTAVGESGLAGIVFDLYKFVRTDVTTFTSGKVVTTFVWDNLTDGLPNKDAKNVDIDAAVSGKHGEFWFTGLDEGKYEVVERAAQGDWVQSTSQSKISPIVRDDDKDKNVLTVGLDPAKSATLYTIISGREYAWSDQLNKQDANFDYQDIYIRDVDGDSKVTDVDRLAHHNQWALKELVLPPPGVSGEQNDLWFGNYKLGSITGIKYEDVNQNGTFDNGEPTLAGVVFRLSGGALPATGKGSSVLVTTGADGKFSFGNLVPSSKAYSVNEVDFFDLDGDKVEDLGEFTDTNRAADIAATKAIYGGSGFGIRDSQQGMIIDETARTFTISSGTNLVDDKIDSTSKTKNLDWGNYITGSIHGYKFEDTDGSGSLNGKEAALAGITFDLYKFVRTDVTAFTSGKVVTTYIWDNLTDGVGAKDVPAATTDSHGEFWFTGLDAGTYEVVERNPDATKWGQSTKQPTEGPGTRDDGDKNANTKGINPATSSTAFEVLSRREYVWTAGAASRVMNMDQDPAISNAEKLAGYNKGALKTEILAPASFGQTAPENNLWFGNFRFGTITGFKYEDLNQNGTQDKDEPGLSGVVFKLSGGALGNTVRYTTTKAGSFTFDKIVPSATPYSVNEVAWDDLNKDGKVDAKDQFTDTNSKADKDFTGNSFGIPDSMQGMIINTTPRTFTISSGDTPTKNLDWGNFVTGSIHGFKFEDKDASGTAVGESGLAGIVFDLYKFVRTDVTTFTSGKVVTTFVWDNLTDGLPNKDAKNVDIDAAVSGKHGEFWFTGLDEGKYEVVERAAQGDWVQSTSQSKISPIVRDDDKDKNVLTVGLDPAKSATLYTIISGREYAWSDQLNKQDANFDYQDIYIRDVDGDGKVTDVDRLAHHNQWALKELVLPPPGVSGEQNDLWFGNYKLGSITGIKYEDVNQNGTFDNGEPTLAGVVFRLSGGALPATGKGSSVLVTTGADGKFSFGNLVPSSKAYSVNEVDFFDLDGDKVEDLGEFTDTNRAADIAATKAIYGGSGFGIRDSQQGMIIDETARTFTISSGTNLVDDKIDSTSKTKNLDWGNYITGSIHGYKFEDTDGSGSLNGSEAALAGITFDLYKFVRTDVTAFTSGKVVTTYIWDNLTDGVGAKDVPAATTDSHGEFWFTGLDAGTYEVVERNPDATKWGQSTKQPTEGPGTRDDGDKNANTKGINPATSSTAFEVLSRREYVWTAGAASRVMNMDQDPAISNAEKLAGYNKGALKTEILAPASFGQTAPENNLWFGNFRFGTITGFKYEDLNQNGTQDKDEPGLSGVVFKLSGGALGNTVRYTTTKAGSFTFDKIVPSATPYSVNEVAWDDLNKDGKVDAKDQFTDTNTLADTNFTGNSFGIPDSMQGMIINTTPRSFTISSGTTQTKNLEWGNYVTGSIHGFKFHDYDRDGVWDQVDQVDGNGNVLSPAEPPLAGVVFDLYKFVRTDVTNFTSGKVVTTFVWDNLTDGLPNKDAKNVDIDAAVSDKHGEFWFTGLGAGTYEVVERTAGGLVATTKQPTTSPSVRDTDNNPNTIGLDPATSSTEYVIQSRREFVWRAGAASAWMDLNGDTKIDDSEKLAAYNAGALKREILATPNNPDVNLNPLDANAAIENQDLWFGNNYVTGAITGFKFEDINGNQVYDKGNLALGSKAEPGLPNIFIEIRDSTGKIALTDKGFPATGTTDINGRFVVAGLIPGAYTIHENLGKSDSNFDAIPDNQQGMVQSTKTAPATTVGPGEEWVFAPGAGALPLADKFADGAVVNGINENLVIGNYVTGSIHGFKFLDLNADGKYDPSAMGKETPFAGVVFEVLDSKGASVGTATTNAAGEFWFNDLLPGTYTLRERLELVDKNGNNIPDNKEGLAASTKSSIQLTINSRQELVWTTGAAMLPGTQSVEPDNTPAGAIITPAVGPSTTAKLSMAFSGNPVYSMVPAGFPASTGARVYGYKIGPNDVTTFQATPGTFFQADFAPLPVDKVSIDVIADNNGDIGQLVAFDATGTPISSVQSSVLSAGQIQKLTLTAPAGQKIFRVQAAGLGGITPLAVGLDNLQYTVNPLKQEVNVGEQLYFGNYYSGSIHGLKLQQGTNLPAPNLPFELIDAWNKVVGTAKSDATGHFWFSDVKPGSYTLVETATPSVISSLPAIPVVVGHGQAVFATDIPTANRMFHVGLQTPVDNHALTIHNLIRGSIHGTVSSQAGAPVVGVPVVIISGPTPGSTITDGTGEFDFEDRVPGTYVLQIGGANGQIRVITVDSGEEEVGKVGQSQLDPGQYEGTPNNDLNIVVFVADTLAPKIGGVRLNSSNWTQPYRDLIDSDSKGAGTGVGFKMPTGAAQATPWSWSNVNQIIVEFTEDVKGSGPGGTLLPADFAILGVNNVAYTISSISYNPATFRATLNLANFLPRDKYLVTANDLTIRDNSGNFLDGEFTNYSSTMPTGNGTQNGIFNYRFNVAPGNYDLSMDGVVATLDLGAVSSSFFTMLGQPAYNKHADADGDGIIATLDLGVVGVNFFTMLPAGSPGGFAQMGSASNLGLAAEGEGSDDMAGLVTDQSESSYDDYGTAVDSIFADLDDEDEDEGDLEYSLYDDLLSSDSDQ